MKEIILLAAHLQSIVYTFCGTCVGIIIHVMLNDQIVPLPAKSVGLLSPSGLRFDWSAFSMTLPSTLASKSFNSVRKSARNILNCDVNWSCVDRLLASALASSLEYLPCNIRLMVWYLRFLAPKIFSFFFLLYTVVVTSSISIICKSNLDLRKPPNVSWG